MDKNVYPHAHALKENLKNLPGHSSISLHRLYDIAVEIVQEYEHGTADIESLGIDNLKQYIDVIVDYLLFVNAIGDDHEETDHRRCNG